MTVHHKDFLPGYFIRYAKIEKISVMCLRNTEKIYSANHLIFSDLHLPGEFLQNFFSVKCLVY